MSVSFSHFLSPIHHSLWPFIIPGNEGVALCQKAQQALFLHVSEPSHRPISTIKGGQYNMKRYMIGDQSQVLYIQLVPAKKSHLKLPFLILLLPLPPIRFNICNPFPLKSMSWPRLPSHLIYFNSLQVFLILQSGTSWHTTHCYTVLHGQQKAVLCSLAFGQLSGPLWAKLKVLVSGQQTGSGSCQMDP